MLNPQQVVAQARGLLGVRFRHQGRDVAHGVDCLGLLLVVADKLQLRFDAHSVMALDQRHYRTKPDTEFLRAQLAQWLLPIEKTQTQIGDIILLCIDGSPQHLAILSDYPLAGEMGMIHAYAPARRVVEHRYDTPWRRATYAAYRLPQLV